MAWGQGWEGRKTNNSICFHPCVVLFSLDRLELVMKTLMEKEEEGLPNSVNGVL